MIKCKLTYDILFSVFFLCQFHFIFLLLTLEGRKYLLVLSIGNMVHTLYKWDGKTGIKYTRMVQSTKICFCYMYVYKEKPSQLQ